MHGHERGRYRGVGHTPDDPSRDVGDLWPSERPPQHLQHQDLQEPAGDQWLPAPDVLGLGAEELERSHESADLPRFDDEHRW